MSGVLDTSAYAATAASADTRTLRILGGISLAPVIAELITETVHQASRMCHMQIDSDRVHAVLNRFKDLDPYQSYYIKDSVPCESTGPLVPETASVLRNAFEQSERVLDVGCGDGRTLLGSASLFGHGTGIDESADHMIALAIQRRDAEGIQNVDFQFARSIALPFEDQAFDMVFSERGPLGHADGPLEEALRVLHPGGLIFVETGGDFATLDVERSRFEKLGVKIQTLCAREDTLVFPDFYAYLTYQCASWEYSGNDLPSTDDEDRLAQMQADATDEGGRITAPYQTIWVGGAKNA